MIKRFIFTISCFFLLMITAAWADINLSVTPADGGNSIRFETVNAGNLGYKEEVHVRINSTSGKYQVFERILQPIVNENGEILNLQAISVQALSGSNSNGTLYLQNEDHLTMGEQLLYSSSQNGSSDAFIIGYALNRSLINTSGTFRGRLLFSVRGLGNSGSDELAVDVLLHIVSNFKLTIAGDHTPNAINIKSTDLTEKAADHVNFSFSGNSGEQIRIYQELDSVPQNEMNQPLASGALQLDAAGNGEDLKIGGISSLGPQRTLIYSGNKDADNFQIYFLVDANQIASQAAGNYTGKIRYVVETDHSRQEIPLNIQCSVSPVFTMNVSMPPGGINFSHVLPNSPPQDEEVLVTVTSNLNKPYQVMQNLDTLMTNQQGKEFNNQYFTLQVEIPAGQKGQTSFTEFSRMQTGDFPVFTSDASGSSATFKLLYRLQGYSGMSPGNFTAPIRLSLNQE